MKPNHRNEFVSGKRTQVSKRSINVKQIIGDIRAGMSDPELSARYGLNEEQLHGLFRQLLQTKMITKGELYGRSSLHPQTEAIQTEDQSSRHYLAFPLPVQDSSNPSVVGRVRDIAEKSIGVVGIEAKAHQEKTLVIFPEKFCDVPPLTFQARCTWARINPSGDCVARFEVIHISPKDNQLLHKLIELLALGV